MKTGKGLVDFCLSKLGMPYVYGMKMQLMTIAKYKELKRLYGSMVWDSDINKVGKICCDCSGLITAYTGKIIGSSMMKTQAKETRSISDINNAPVGAILWQNGHVGVYMGLINNKHMYVAEDGSAYGCRTNEVKKARFTHYLLMNDIDYSDNVQKVQVIINKNTYKVQVLDSLNVRTDSNKDSKVIGKYFNNDLIEVLQVRNLWGKTTKGWCSLEFTISLDKEVEVIRQLLVKCKENDITYEEIYWSDVLIGKRKAEQKYIDVLNEKVNKGVGSA